jgi:membrane protein YdbS with pleckstrin-like domain
MLSPKPQGRWPKYKMLPLALLLYLVVMSVYGWKRFHLEDRMGEFCLIVAVEVVIIVLLYFLLKRQYKRRQRYDEEE